LNSESTLHEAFVSLAKTRGVDVSRAVSGIRVNLGGGVFLDVLHPPADPLIKTGADAANNTAVLRLTYGKVSLLMLRGLRIEGEEFLLARKHQIRSTVLAISSSGKANVPSEKFLRAVSPSVVLVDGNFDSSQRSVLKQRVDKVLPGTRIVDVSGGRISKLVTDGERVWIK
jgi:beta-lactamase superfamily II metal-dependent hydrolase